MCLGIRRSTLTRTTFQELLCGPQRKRPSAGKNTPTPEEKTGTLHLQTGQIYIENEGSEGILKKQGECNVGELWSGHDGGSEK